MMGELTIYSSAGEFVLSVNGGECKVRKLSQKPYESKPVSPAVWSMLYPHFYAIQDIVNASQSLDGTK